MKIIDLSKLIYEGMEVYPGDPSVKVKQIHFLEKQGWQLRKLEVSTHLGSHVDAPAHMKKEGKTIDQLKLEKFIGKTVVVEKNESFPKKIGLAFREGKLELDLLEKLRDANPKFVIVGNQAELSLELEKGLLENDILTITDLVNMEKLPSNKPFMFFGVTLKIKDGDGCPIRAFAYLED